MAETTNSVEYIFATDGTDDKGDTIQLSKTFSDYNVETTDDTLKTLGTTLATNKIFATKTGHNITECLKISRIAKTRTVVFEKADEPAA